MVFKKSVKQVEVVEYSLLMFESKREFNLLGQNASA